MQRLVHFTFAALVIMIGMLLPSQAAPIETDVNIVTGLDISDSVSADDVVLQIDGIAAAVRSPEFLRAIGGGPNRRIGFAVTISGIKTTGVVRCDQPRVLDLRERSGRKVDTLPPEILAEVLARLAPIFE